MEPSISDRVFCVRASAWIRAASLLNSKSRLPWCSLSINLSIAASVSATRRESAAAMVTYSGSRLPNRRIAAAE